MASVINATERLSMSARDSVIDVEKEVNIHLENKKISRNFFWFLWALYVIVYISKSNFNGALASIVSDGVMTKSQTGFIIAMFYIVYAPFQIIGGMIVDKRSPERMIKIGLLGAIVANIIVFFFSDNYYVMLAAWTFNGIIQFGIWPGIFKIISSQLVKEDRKMMSYYISFSTTAGLITTYLLAAIVPHWKYSFIITIVALALFTVGLHLFEKRLSPYMKWDRKEKYEVDNNSSKVNYSLSTKEVLLKSGFFFVVASLIFSTATTQSQKTFASIMFVENYDKVSSSLGNILTIVFLIAGLIGTLLAGKICKSVKNEVLGMAISFGSMIPPLIVCSFVGSVPIFAMVSCFSIVAVAESFSALLRTRYTMTYAKFGKSGMAAGILNSAMAASFVLSSYVVPLLIENFGWHTAIFMWAMFMVIAAILLLISNTKYKKMINQFSTEETRTETAKINK